MTQDQGSHGQHHASTPATGTRRDRRFDPTWPALGLGFVVVLFAAIFSMTNLFPAGALETLLNTGDRRPQAEQSAQSELTDTEGEVDVQVPTALPVATSVEVFSWNDDGGDHSELAGYILDNDPSTTWRSRYFGNSVFAEGSEISLLIRLAEPALVSQVTIDVTGSGGLVAVTVPEEDNPRGGTVLAESSLSPQTIIPISPAVELSSIGLVFKELPSEDEGRFRAKITGITVE